ncbi:MAG: CHASE domain-containing protein [Gammaproteobacteria bacterium]|nr:CHASE domain-containing protein [Gammaproteobacteria bacterium]MBU1625360.1 CHASE domain-containing protein [Gammaproteobacteria bacterium]MBU1981620.1 CHASE domain-containing protein [Gammaproteobacteria bacterium]
MFFSYEAKVDTDKITLEHFDADADEMRMHLLETLSSHEQVLLGAAALFDSSSEVSRDEWQRYVNRIQLNDHFKSVQGLGYAHWIPPGQLASHIASVRREGFPDYDVWPKQNKNAYSSIVYLEPFTGRNLRAFGYDMYSEPTRRAAMERARDTNSAALSGKVKLVQETTEDVQAGTLMYLPLYRKGMPYETEAQRRVALYGWVYSPFRMKDMVEHALSDTKPEDRHSHLQLSIHDGREISADTELYSNNVQNSQATEPVTIEKRLEFGGKEWTLVTKFYDLKGSGLDYSKAKTIFFSGTLTSILLYFLITALTQSRAALNKAEIAVSELRKSEENLRVLAKNESVLIWLATPDKKCTYFNQVWLDFTGHTVEQELGDGWVAGVHPDDRESCLHTYILAFDARREFTLEYRLLHHSGEYRWIVDHGVPRFDNKGVFLGYIGSGVDINDRKKSEAQLQLSMFAMDKAFDAIYWLDKDGCIRYVNNQGCKTLGYSREELMQLCIPDLDPDFPVAQWMTHWEALKHDKSQLFETRHRRKDGSIIPIEVSANHVKLGELEYNIAFCRDISKRKEIEQEIYSLAFFDPLTHLPNRRMLSDRLSKSLANSKRNDAYGALLFIDLDNFKPINDQCGHEVGDQLLLEVARRLNTTVREIDTVARYGGDEFVVVLGDLSSSQDEMKKQAHFVAEKIAATLAEPYQLTRVRSVEKVSVVHECTSSIGITLFDGKTDNQYDIISRGDSAMYQAKEAGRNQIHMYTPM